MRPPSLSLALLLCLLAGFRDPILAVQGRAQKDPAQEQLYSDVRDRLESDEDARETLARRIARSTLGVKISAASDETERLAEISAWIRSDPQSAAYLAVGLAQDEAEGGQKYENWLNRNVSTRLEPNPEAQKGIFGRLKKSNLNSTLMRQDEEMGDEERSEILKTLFEGRGGASNKILTQQEKEKEKSSGGAAPSPLNAGYYDRLSRGNLRGYSPQLQALQSSLNASRPPGAPKLVETGKLDFETLSYPAHGMRYDIRNLEMRLRYERNFALAKLLGRHREFTAEQLLYDDVEAQLKAQAGPKAKLNARFQKRQAALERAAVAARDFEAAALPSKNKLKITRALLQDLGAKQKEAARWITAASLEEELQRIESEEQFLSPELLALIDRAPVEPDARAAYRRRGEEFKNKILAIKANSENALTALESDGWRTSLENTDALLSQNSVLRKNLSRNISDFVQTPYRLVSNDPQKPLWRRWADDLIKRFSYGAYAQSLKRSARRQETLKDVFLKIAQGDLDAAHSISTSML